MLIKIIYTLISLTAFCFYFTTNSYNSELVFLDEWKSIRELKENINNLDEYNSDLDGELKNLNTDYKLKTFLRKNLTIVELNKIRKITSEYNNNKVKIELNLRKKSKELLSINTERKLLLEEKRNLYNWLIPYIDSKYKQQYLEYIKSDAKIFNEKKDIASDIISKKEVLSNKVENIETKIKQHNNFINQSIRKIIESRLDEKINNLNQNESFKILNNDSKIKIINKTIEKIRNKLENIELLKTDNSNTWWLIKTNWNILTKKIETYDIAIEKLESFRDLFK